VGVTASRTVERVGWLAVALVSCVLLFASFRVPPAISPDPAFGILAAEQTRVEKSASILDLRIADPQDLNRDIDFRVSCWAPGYQAVPYLWVYLTGANWGQSFGLTFLFLWPVGLIGWGAYFWLCLGKKHRRSLVWMMLAFVCFYSTSGAAIKYRGGQFLLWSLFPISFWLTLSAVAVQNGKKRLALAGCGGVFTASLFLVKYSAMVVTLGMGLFWLGEFWLRRTRRKEAIVWIAGAGVTSLLIRLAGFPGGPTPATGAVAGRTFEPSAFIEVIGQWGLAVTDTYKAVFRIFGTSLQFINENNLCWLGLPIALFCIVLWYRLGWLTRNALRTWSLDDSPAGIARRLAVWISVSYLLCIALIEALMAYMGRDPRLLILPGMLAFPFVFVALLRTWKSPSRTARLLALIGLMGLIVLPAVYGAVSKLRQGHLADAGRELSVGNHGVYLHDVKSAPSFPAILEELDSHVKSNETIWCTSSPAFALHFSERRMIVLSPLAILSGETAWGRFAGDPSGGLMLILPEHYEAHGTLRAIQASFVDIPRWRKVPLRSDPGWTLHVSY
jgi:hypothetical protein